MQTTLDNLVIKEDFYRHSPASARIYPCPDELACAGTPKDDDAVVGEDEPIEEDERDNFRIEGDELCRVGFEVRKPTDRTTKPRTTKLIQRIIRCICYS